MNNSLRTPPPSAAFSFKVKALIIEIAARITNVKILLDLLVQGEEGRAIDRTQDALEALETAAKEFHAISHLNLPILNWLEAALELTDREILAVAGLREDVSDLAARILQEPLRSWQDAEIALMYIRRVEWNLEEIKDKMQQERNAALEKDRQQKKDLDCEKLKNRLWAIAGNIISGVIGAGIIRFFFLD